MTTRRRSPGQTVFQFGARGGARPGEGRPRNPANVGLLPHVARPALDRHVPMHATLRAAKGTPNLRAEHLTAIVREEIRRASAKGNFRVVHFSIQTNHLHLIVEANTGGDLSRGVQRLASRVARLINIAVGRRGRFWRERYHRADLSTPRQVRNALVYCLCAARRLRGSTRGRPTMI